MMQNRRVLTSIVIALIFGAALALAVAVASSRSGAPGASATGAPAEAGAPALLSDTGTQSLAAADPAKEEPVLDKFTSKDPFIPLPTPGATTTSTASPSPSPTSSPASDLSAKVKVDGTAYNVTQGDKVPGGSAAEFTITGVTTSDVTFKVIDGKLKNGDTSFSVNVGDSVKVTLESGVSYDIEVVSVGQPGSGSGGTTTSSHSISVVSLSSQNGTALVTIAVDGKTYSDLKQGDVVSTSWGEIKIVAIDLNAQTVTVMHGDQTLTLAAGQVVVK
jgi:hypothetical protein